MSRARWRAAGRWLRRRAENVAAAMLAAMFVAFVLQVAFRYLLNFPVGWTAELSVVLWLWLILWGAAFVIEEREQVRFDLLGDAAPRPLRRALALGAALAVLVLYGASLPASWSYVAFMKVEKSAYLRIRMDALYAIYLVFLVAVLARYGWRVVALVRGRDPEDAPAGQAP
ncbi:MAG: TRAP transporter small permease subunit [Burkholderiales bacterium]|nr:TRAP transporter small permease subunit [Burkholderiales bacterium]